ncbi:serine hydrolase domain-containing protein [Mucilaginibacter antarcticus]|uniref:Serine hydrolase domain-containing protein n=2 Tax=Mucilaginibacter antarcticus TaxID=1855725 RepID=A0ABW5XMQ8_9SPHI
MLAYRRVISLAVALQLSLVLLLNGQDLPRSKPEDQGVDSKGILGFVNATRSSKTEFHSFMLVRHGKVVAEGWWNPYKPELRHTLYSCSKSFTASAIGFAVAEKKLALTDKVISFFPDKLPANVSPNLAALTVKDALIMADGQDPEPSRLSAEADWVKGFLATPIVHQPGSVFLYNSLGTYMLSAIIQKVSGQTLLQYLKPRLFDPLDIKGMDWETDLNGVNTGGWGLRVKTEDMAKFAQLFLQHGQWNGKQVLPKGWAEEASSVKIIQHPDLAQARKDASDWEQGYAYQMWRCRYNAYRGDGAFGQLMIVMPDQDAVLAITAETSDMQGEINLVWRYLLPAMTVGKLPANKIAYAQLQTALKELALPPATNSSVSEKKNGTYQLEANKFNFSTATFNNKQLTLKNDTASYTLDFGAGAWQTSTTQKPGPSLTAGAQENRSMLFPAKVAGNYSWTDERTIQLTLRYIESPHTEKFTCIFDDQGLTMKITNTVERGKETIIKGKLR